jgi:hypothetical protein
MPPELLPLSGRPKYIKDSALCAGSKWVSLRISDSTPDIPLLILKDESQRIRAAWSKKRQPLHLTIPCGRDSPIDSLLVHTGSPDCVRTEVHGRSYPHGFLGKSTDFDLGEGAMAGAALLVGDGGIRVRCRP